MNNKELEQIGESIWDTYKKLATCLVERRKLSAATQGSEPVELLKRRARKLETANLSLRTGNQRTEPLT